MKTVYIPKGVTAVYDSLETEHLAVQGCLKVAHGLKAETISGNGVILAGTISADDIHASEIEAASVYCLRLTAKRVQADEVFASESAMVSCYLCADYVLSARLMVNRYQVGKLNVCEIINLPMKAKRPHPFWMLLTMILHPFRAALAMFRLPPENEHSIWMLLATILHPFQVVLAKFRSVFCTGEIMDAEYQQVPENVSRPAA